MCHGISSRSWVGNKNGDTLTAAAYIYIFWQPNSSSDLTIIVLLGEIFNVQCYLLWVDFASFGRMELKSGRAMWTGEGGSSSHIVCMWVEGNFWTFPTHSVLCCCCCCGPELEKSEPTSTVVVCEVESSGKNCNLSFDVRNEANGTFSGKTAESRAMKLAQPQQMQFIRVCCISFFSKQHRKNFIFSLDEIGLNFSSREFQALAISASSQHQRKADKIVSWISFFICTGSTLCVVCVCLREKVTNERKR